MDYRIYSFEINEEIKDLVLVDLLEAGFDSFEENENRLDAYIADDNVDKSKELEIEEIAEKYNTPFTWEFLEDQNWNSLWEQGFNPVRIGDFCYIRADWHPPQQGIRFDLVINPKMAFGTGHHETTFMVMSFMENIQFSGKKVLDFGCGTGILAILASKLQSKEVWAIDYDPHSVENTEENAEVNQIENIHILEGDLGVLKENNFDIILANINKNVLLRSMAILTSIINPDGILILSGILNTDKPVLIESAETHSFIIQDSQSLGEWTALKLLKKATN